MESETGTTALRQLGHAEKYSTTRSHLGIYLNVGLTARYKRPRGVAVKPALFRALSQMIWKHPILSAIPIAADTTSPYFVRLPYITLSKVVAFVEDYGNSLSSDGREYLDNVLEEQHNRPFKDPTLPFWRICVLEYSKTPTHFTLMLIVHHSLMDTQSALSVHEELEGLMSQDARYEPDDTIDTPSASLLPPLEDLYTLTVSQEFLESQNAHQEPPPDSWTAVPQSTPVRTRFSSLLLSTAETMGLAAMSKKEQTSVTAALQTLIASSIFSALPSRYRTLQADCAVSLRRFLPEPIRATSLGCYVGSLSMTYGRMVSFNWTEARHTKTIIDQELAKGASDMPVGYLGHIPDQHAWMLQKLGRRRMSAFELSNIGKVPASRKLSFEIESILFSQSASACSAAIKVSAVTGRDGLLALGFTWQEGIVEANMIEQIKQTLKCEVDKLVLHG
ncbi:hypothetical protein BDV27DRAFT_167193 [Aspergillus caelatus]|uniref:Alcohol acetyltransferase n=1 Tax=Aspergillus caelatus TaxID=61420 RepID=A0A5N6ZU78_9EURO|nr:uncharacterized protein BDV27DRAFT_167193 [Aspergillus caelatus]KAE8361082.1 hypothetical protein BDV27DRAFT_167193 [Aspergillus caelatus]